MRLSVIALCLALLAQSAAAAETLETAVANHMTVPYVLTLEGPAPRHVAVLYPGGDGVVEPHIKPNGRLAYKKKPNFLVRTRALLVDRAARNAAFCVGVVAPLMISFITA